METSQLVLLLINQVMCLLQIVIMIKVFKSFPILEQFFTILFR
jgi:hypothetical protein